MIRPVPNNNEITFADNQIIVSKTDTKGKITYGNKTFIEISGYSEEELLDQPHSILRHPDMPKAIFKLLWDAVQSKKEINAYVKNLAKDGSYYWVLANVTTSLDKNNEIIGYFSVRRKPKKDAVEKVSDIYKKMLKLERTGGMTASLQYLTNLLEEKGVTYEEFIISL
ncbi:MAG: PAS domain-containing protein [Sulfurimonas sp.]